MPREFRADIQALRGIAVLLVVIYHANVGLFPAGYLGVDIFFVISGFLITGLIKTHLEEGRFSFREFYYRRAKRLLPAAYTVIALTTIAAPFFLSDIGLQEFKFQVLGAITFTGNIALWLQSDYFAQAAETKPLLHVWSLAIEEQYYLLLPAFLLATPARLWLRVVGLLLVISLALC
ncbi:acyltransferase, partial [Vibrio parahaemolyticus]|nr:acyltransferase [Vibrio parahaemolyticus]